MEMGKEEVKTGGGKRECVPSTVYAQLVYGDPSKRKKRMVPPNAIYGDPREEYVPHLGFVYPPLKLPKQEGMVPPNAIHGDPKEEPLQQTNTPLRSHVSPPTPPQQQAGIVPPKTIYGDPKGVPLQQTMFMDTPAPFSCVYCGSSGLTTVRSKPSLAAVVGCMMPFMLGCCFLCPSMDCLWHKYHYCPSCGQKVADFEKSDPCLVMDPPRWTETSFALPA